jgi:hypothetical protein
MAQSGRRVMKKGGVKKLGNWANSVSESSGFQMIVGVGPGATTIHSLPPVPGKPRDDVLSPGDVLWAPRSVRLSEKGCTEQLLRLKISCLSEIDAKAVDPTTKPSLL